MSTPMYDIPEHCWISLTEQGNGPAYDEEFDHWGCWCGDTACTLSPGDMPDYVPHEEF